MLVYIKPKHTSSRKSSIYWINDYFSALFGVWWFLNLYWSIPRTREYQIKYFMHLHNFERGVLW